MRPLWPYVTDKVAIEALKKEQPFEVAACWNGVAAFPAKPYLWKPGQSPQASLPHLDKRGWRMMDNRESSGSPNVTSRKCSC